MISIYHYIDKKYKKKAEFFTGGMQKTEGTTNFPQVCKETCILSRISGALHKNRVQILHNVPNCIVSVQKTI